MGFHFSCLIYFALRCCWDSSVFTLFLLIFLSVLILQFIFIAVWPNTVCFWFVEGRSFNGILRSLPLKGCFLYLSEHGGFRHYQVSLGLKLMLLVLDDMLGHSWDQKWQQTVNILVPVAELAFAVFGFLSYQRSHYMVALGNVESWIYNSGTWLTSAQQGILVSEGRLQTVGSISSTELQSLYTKLSSFFKCFVGFHVASQSIFFLSPIKRNCTILFLKSFHHSVPYWTLPQVL